MHSPISRCMSAALERFQVAVVDVHSGSPLWPFSGKGLPRRKGRAAYIASLTGRNTPAIVCAHGLHDSMSREQFIQSYQSHFSANRIQWLDDTRVDGFDDNDIIPSSTRSRTRRIMERLSFSRFECRFIFP